MASERDAPCPCGCGKTNDPSVSSKVLPKVANALSAHAAQQGSSGILLDFLRQAIKLPF
jgi:hypothetical protein